jgi:acyl carrier protein
MNNQQGMDKQEIIVELMVLLKYLLARDNMDDVTPQTRFREDLDMDSLSVVDMAMEMEDKFGFQLPSDYPIFEEVHTLDDAAELIINMKTGALAQADA